MVEIAINDWNGDVATALAEWSARLGLTIASDGTLASYPGSRHWHLKNGGRAGTLEVTLWPERNRLWVSYHVNRVGDGWVTESALDLAKALAASLRGQVHPLAARYESDNRGSV